MDDASRYPHPATEVTSRVMRANRRTGTTPESRVRGLLHRKGLRFRKDLTLRLGASYTRPDIVFTRLRLAVFIDGCFWHGCPRHGTRPKRNAWYWAPKLTRNRERDLASASALRRAGWVVRRYWEHMPAEGLADRVAALVARMDGR